VPDPRAAFLSEIAARLDLPEPLAHDVLEELAGHVDDTAASLRAAGYEPPDAERRAIAGLGDPGELAAGIGRAHHGRRQLLAAAGGGVRAVLVEGMRTYLFIALALVLASILAIPIASALLHALGRSTSSYFGGPVGSLVTVGGTAGGLAYLGWILPARIAVPAVRSVRGVRRPVAWLGSLVGSIIVWLLVPLAMDPVLAVGLPLAPAAFALAALRAPDHPTVRAGFGPAAVLAVILVIPMTIVALATTTSSEHGGWMADMSPIGAAPAATDVANTDVRATWSALGNGYEHLSIALGPAAPVLIARYPVLRIEVWSAVDMDGVIRFGSAPLLARQAPTEASVDVSWSMPRPRDRITTATFVVGIARDGGRTILAEDLGLDPTPPWTGTVAEWWLGR
jgi:HAAS